MVFGEQQKFAHPFLSLHIIRHPNRRHHQSILAISEGPKLPVDLAGGDLAVSATGSRAETVRHHVGAGARGVESTERAF